MGAEMKRFLLRLLHCFGWHWWRTVRDTGKTVYEQCDCGKRRAWQRWPGIGVQPIDEGWVYEGGRLLVSCRKCGKEQIVVVKPDVRRFRCFVCNEKGDLFKQAALRRM